MINILIRIEEVDIVLLNRYEEIDKVTLFRDWLVFIIPRMQGWFALKIEIERRNRSRNKIWNTNI